MQRHKKKQLFKKMIHHISGRRLYFALLISLAVIFIVSAATLVLHYTQAANEQAALQELSEKAAASFLPTPTAVETPDSTPATTPSPTQTPRERIVLEQYRELYEQNPDMVGWIRIDGTKIDYPVMYTPNDGEFYLNHGFDKEKSKSGVPFIDSRCTIDPFGTNTIIYGHHMKNGTMFAGLLNYEDEDFFREHPIICFDTLYEQQEYEIIAVFESQVYRKSDTVFKHYNFLNAASKADFDAYIANIKALSLYDTGVTASYGDELITLSTCAYHVDNGQFVVVARKPREVE